jgi:hypothetical protein
MKLLNLCKNDRRIGILENIKILYNLIYAYNLIVLIFTHDNVPTLQKNTILYDTSFDNLILYYHTDSEENIFFV